MCNLYILIYNLPIEHKTLHFTFVLIEQNLII